MKAQITHDLGLLALERCRDAFMTVGQLVDDDTDRAAMLVSVAADMLRGAASMLGELKDLRGRDQRQLFDYAVSRMVEAVHEEFESERKRKSR